MGRADLSASPYLSGLLERFGAPDETTAAAAIASATDISDLADAKARFDLGWSHLALRTGTPFSALGQLQSEMAETAIDRALREAWAHHRLTGEPRGLFVLGLGKLGGHDLNFSSDIDLIAYFDPDTFPVPEARGQAHVAGQIMRRLSQTLQPRGRSPVYRVDWRLRPEASVSGLAMSTLRAQDFYFFRALPWHRLALMKARVVGGDRAAGAAFLSELTPWLWRQNLDFRTLDQLGELKSRIDLEHPNLRREREEREPIGAQPLGFNVKLGTGGIREIEFIANAQQLIWGGKAYALRTTNTLAALRELGVGGWVKDADMLRADYVALRRLENALQMMRGAQEHVLPGDADGWTRIAALLGEEANTLMAATTAIRRRVHARFAAMFADPDAQTEPSAPPPVTSSATDRIISDWRAGFRRYGARSQRLGPLAAALEERVARAPDPDAAVLRIDAYLGQLSRSEQYLRLLAANPSLLGALVEPLLYSPHMSVLLEQSPHIIDSFLSPAPPAPAFVLSEPDYETRLERLRRFVNEGLFLAYHRFLERGDAGALAQALTHLAEAAIETALTIARDDLGQPELPISVLGLGKLGEGRMAPQSDLDLIFLFADDVDRELAGKAVRRLRTTLTARGREGIAYELDMRLRPSGRSGPPAVTLSAFTRHHAKSARSWEHIALVPARVVAGDAELGAQVAEARDAVIARPRDAGQLIADARHMWGLLQDERIRDVPPDVWGTKLRGGGLMQADFWGAVGALSGGETLQDVRMDWTERLYWERLLGLTGQSLDAAPALYAARMPEPRFAELEAQVRAVTDGYAGAPSESMEPVRWL